MDRFLLESPLIQELLEEKLREVRQAVLLRVLQARFGPVPQDLADRVRAIQDVEFLWSLLDPAVVSPDLDTFRAKLPS
jgi:hypothetical protein